MQDNNHRRLARCSVCKQRITMGAWEPYCCQVCHDSADAERRRDYERNNR